MQAQQCLEEMLIALKANIEYLQSEGNQQLKITNGTYLKAVAEFHIYRFNIPPLREVELDQDIEVKINFSTTSGKVISSSNDQIELKLEKYIGETIAEAYLIVSNYFLLQKLFDKLTEIKDGNLKIANTAEKLFGLMEFVSSKESSYDISLISRNHLDEDKVEALKLSLGSEVSLIWGPPGTGKTQLIATLIESLTSNNKSVLLLSHTNKATDGALLRTVDYFNELNSPVLTEGKILRIGKIFDEKLKTYDYLTPEYAVKQKSKPLIDEIERLSKLISDIEDKLSQAKEMQEKFERLARLSKLNSEAKIDFENQKRKWNDCDIDLKNLTTEIEQTEIKIANYHKSTFIGRLFSGLNLDNLVRQKSQLISKIGHCNNLLKEISTKYEYAQQVVNDTNEQLSILNNEIGNSGYSQFQSDFTNLSDDLKSKLKERDILLKQVDELSISVIKDALVIGTTLTKSYLSKVVLSRPYDCVIIDEASMAPMPAMWCAAGLANSSITIIGDFLQLPPIAQYKQLKDKHKTEEELQIEANCVDRWLKTDVFHQLGIVEAIKNKVEIKYLKQLTYQYRMHPDIADLINTLVYGTYGAEYKLKSDQSTGKKGADRLANEPMSGSHVGIINTNTVGTLAIRTENGSRYNLYHALLAVQLAKIAINNGYTEIGIISPFRAQANLIKMILKDSAKETPNILDLVSADTVHKYQGDERQIIIFDTVTADPTRLTDDNADHGQDEQLMNVAFSRAKEKCIVLADVEKIDKKHSETSILKKFVDYCRTKNHPIKPCEDLLHGYPISDEEEEWLKKMNKQKIHEEFHQSELFNQDNFYQAFISDLLKAEQEVIIVSPFLTHERMNTFLPIFNFLLRKKVKIFIVTRMPKLHDDGMRQQSTEIINELEEMGVIVLPLSVPMHQKLAVVDREILWEGSLNILSQRNSVEIMRRFLGSESCKQLLSFLGIDKNIGKIGECRLQRCEYCKKPGAWFWTDKGMYGYWTHCLVGGHKVGKEPASDAERKAKKENLQAKRKQEKARDSDGTPFCPEHDVKMVRKKGKWGKDFWGCPKFPRCRITESL